MENIQNKAIQTYSQNLEFLKKNNKKLFERVITLSSLIESSEYTQRYHLEYIKSDEQFDIFDELNNSYIYNREPKSFIKKALKENNLDKVNSMDLLNHIIYNNKSPIVIDENMPLRFKEKALYANDIFEYINIFRTSTLYKKKIFKYIEKFIFVGTLLGIHIEPILNKLKPNMILIYEYNLEIFRLSLFVTNYAELSIKSNILFSIMEDKEYTEASLGNFFHYAVRSNYMIKYYCTNYNIHDYFDRMLSVSSHKNPLSYSYSKMIEGLLKPAFKNINEHYILNTKIKQTLLSGKPLLFLAAGPSLGKNIDWIKQNQEYFTIIAIGATVIKLYNSNIKPDIITSVDADQIIKQQFPNKVHDFVSDIPFLASAITSQYVLDIFPKENIILYEAMGAFKNTSITMNGYSVGEITLNIIAALGADEIYMIGTDLALDQETGESHTDGQATEKFKHSLDDSKKELNSFVEKNSYDFHNSTLTVKGNFRDIVVTTTTMEKSIMSYNKSIRIILKSNPNTKLFNLSDGALFESTTPIKTIDTKVPSTKKTINKESILKYLNKNSSIGFTKTEKLKLSDAISILNTFIEKIEDIQKLKYKTYDSFLEERDIVLSMIKIDFHDYQVFYLDRIFVTFVLTIEPYLGYQFNDAELKREANLIKKVKNVWCKQILHLANQYKNIVESVL